MISLLPLLLLSGWAASLPSTLIEPPAHKMIHDVMDVIESGMEEPVQGQGRAFWIGLTLTSTSTSLITDTVTTTVTASCVDGMFMECGDTMSTTEMPTTVMPTTTQAVPRRKNKNKKNKNKKNKNKNKNKTRQELLDLVDDIYRDAVVTDEFGQERDVSVLLPDLARSLEIDYTSLDNTVQDVPSLQGGQLRWSEMIMEGQETPACSRKDLGKRPRIFTVDNVVETVTYTSTSTIIETGFNTATFTVSLDSCTTAGFTFAVPMCTDLPTTEMPTTTGAPMG